MEHTNLFLYENESALIADYPDGKVDYPIPGVAYGRASGDTKAKVFFNKSITNYSITIHSQDRRGIPLADDYSIQSPDVLSRKTVRVKVKPNIIEGYRPVNSPEVFEASGDCEHTIFYLKATAYTLTINHMFSGESLTSATTINITDIFEEDVVRVKVEPVSIPGYTAETVYIYISGDTEYDLEYEKSCFSFTYVDLGLPSGTLWATCNLGASEPWEAGNYYAWGEIETKTTFDWDNYKWYDSYEEEITKYNDDDGKYGLDDEHNTALMLSCGGDMPTYDDIWELVNYTDCSFVTIHGVGGALFEGNGNSIFVPHHGYKDGSTIINDFSRFWSLERQYLAWGFGFCDGGAGCFGYDRYLGLNIRTITRGNGDANNGEKGNGKSSVNETRKSNEKKIFFKPFSNVKTEEGENKK